MMVILSILASTILCAGPDAVVDSDSTAVYEDFEALDTLVVADSDVIPDSAIVFDTTAIIPEQGYSLQSTDLETIELRNGTGLLHGFIKEELADGSLVFQIMASKGVIPIEMVSNALSYRRDELSPDLSLRLKRYTPFVDGLGLKENLLVGKNMHPGKSGEYIILEESDSSATVLTFDISLDTIGYDDIKTRISYESSSSKNYGLQDRITIKGGRSFRGYIVRRVPGEEIVFASNGINRTIPIDNIDISEKVIVNQDIPIIFQSPFIVTATFSDGDPVTGVITRMEYETGDMEFVVDHKGKIEKRNMATLLTRSYEVNRAYPPKKQIRLDYDNGKIYANGVLLKRFPHKASNGKIFAAGGDDANLDNVIVKVKLQNDSFTVVRKKPLLHGLMTMDRISNPMGKLSKNELMKGASPSSIVSSIAIDNNGNRVEVSKYQFVGVQPGYYILSEIRFNHFYLLHLVD